MSVTAILVTRGDHDLSEILESLPVEWECIVWDNGFHGYPHVDVYKDGNDWRPDGLPGGVQISDLSVYGRYAAIEYATNELIYVQDDDCVVRDPQAIVDAWVKEGARRAIAGDSVDYLESEGELLRSAFSRYFVVCNMPQEFRHSFYEEHALVGFGAAFHRDAPQRAFKNYLSHIPCENMHFCRTCDIVFTGLTPRVLVDVPKYDLSWAHDDNRMWKQPEHQAERARMLDLMRQVRNGS